MTRPGGDLGRSGPAAIPADQEIDIKIRKADSPAAVAAEE